MFKNNRSHATNNKGTDTVRIGNHVSFSGALPFIYTGFRAFMTKICLLICMIHLIIQPNFEFRKQFVKREN